MEKIILKGKRPKIVPHWEWLMKANDTEFRVGFYQFREGIEERIAFTQVLVAELIKRGILQKCELNEIPTALPENIAFEDEQKQQ